MHSVGAGHALRQWNRALQPWYRVYRRIGHEFPAVPSTLLGPDRPPGSHTAAHNGSGRPGLCLSLPLYTLQPRPDPGGCGSTFHQRVITHAFRPGNTVAPVLTGSASPSTIRMLHSSQIFHAAFHSNTNLLVGAPTGSGKTVIAELAMLRLWKLSPASKV